jgi:biotin synthase
MTKTIPEILAGETFARDDVIALLSTADPADVEAIRDAAYRVLVDNCGTKVYLRGLVEFSNRCACDCCYCGIRKGNVEVKRYTLTKDEIVDAARFCAEAGYGSMVLQSGERRDERFVSFVENVLQEIKRETASGSLPSGLGITLSVGEQTPAVYKRFFDAGAHRYLLRIETSSATLFTSIHPPRQTFEARLACLSSLRDIGYQVGTGVMIGLPGQTVEDLADDVLFFRAIDADMIGMGPFIAHRQTPMARHGEAMAACKKDTLELALRMIAVTRLACPDVNIASTTALQAMDPLGREMGLLHGANVVMPQVTPQRVRRDYQLYEGKPCLDENAQECRACLHGRIRSLGREPASGEWGDPKHFAARQRRAVIPH